MAKIYYRLIRDKAMAIEDVPERWRAATQALLDADEAVEVSGDAPAPVKATEAAPAATVSLLSHMTVAQLREYATNNGINLHGATRREDILAAVEAANDTKGDI